jgi:hypothetical protein
VPATESAPWLLEGADISMEKRNANRLDTTLGELIAAASEVAFEFSNNDKEAYDLAQLALIEILRKTSHTFDLNQDFDSHSHWHRQSTFSKGSRGSPFFCARFGNFGSTLDVLSSRLWLM